jgi:hypothetical protein
MKNALRRLVLRFKSETIGQTLFKYWYFLCFFQDFDA